MVSLEVHNPASPMVSAEATPRKDLIPGSNTVVASTADVLNAPSHAGGETANLRALSPTGPASAIETVHPIDLNLVGLSGLASEDIGERSDSQKAPVLLPSQHESLGLPSPKAKVPTATEIAIEIGKKIDMYPYRRLPDIPQIAQHLECSLTAINEALAILQALGRVRSNSTTHGWYVSEVTAKPQEEVVFSTEPEIPYMQPPMDIPFKAKKSEYVQLPLARPPTWDKIITTKITPEIVMLAIGEKVPTADAITRRFGCKHTTAGKVQHALTNDGWIKLVSSKEGYVRTDKQAAEKAEERQTTDNPATSGADVPILGRPKQSPTAATIAARLNKKKPEQNATAESVIRTLRLMQRNDKLPRELAYLLDDQATAVSPKPQLGTQLGTVLE